MAEPTAYEQIGPWCRKSTSSVYDNRWISVRHEEVITPGGTAGIYGVVHFKSRAVGIIPIDSEGYTWLVRQYRYTLHQHLWEIPMGGCPLQEDPQATARRELEEETGLHAQHLQEIMRLFVSKSVTDEEGVVYLARGLVAGEKRLEETEADLEILRLPFAEAVQWVMDGKITDVISCAALLKAAALLRNDQAGAV